MIVLLLGTATALLPAARCVNQLRPILASPQFTVPILPKLLPRGINDHHEPSDPENPHPRPAQALRRQAGAGWRGPGCAPGTSLVVIGGSGSGKSVLLKCILGLIEPDDGMIEIDGQDILTAAPRRAGTDPRTHRHAVPERRAVRQPAGLGERRLRPARPPQGDPRRRPRPRQRYSWDRSAWPPASAICRRRSCRAACRSASRWRAPSPRSPTSCSSTSPPPAWIRSWAR